MAILSEKLRALPNVRVVLASSSPRRRELVSWLDVAVEPVSPDVDEGPPLEGEAPAEFVTRLALEKARRVARRAGEAVVLAADTAVFLDGVVLGKPGDEREATRMLASLRGRAHSVVTGVACLDAASGRTVAGARSTRVTMRDYSDAEVAAYVASGAPLDKAGGYAVQDDAFQCAEDVDGCYLNVVGLPLCEVADLLGQLGVQVRLRSDSRLPSGCRGCALESGQQEGTRE